ncbi:unnamed protein product [Nippostrongylus brasiliensis]|uniref:Mago-bind domain-containing protein n=1 Tax=Nippostrongylus brasiliensis TaxID=27835 RepID=A0A0N4Y3B3_NIPBR|nr:unnamed protein product [Nippostrongylus brasiliensis]
MAKAFDLTVEISQFHHIIVTTGIKMKQYNDGMKVDLQYVRRADVGHWISKEDYMRGRHAVRRSIARTSSGTGSNSNLARMASASTENLNAVSTTNSSSSSENQQATVTSSSDIQCQSADSTTKNSDIVEVVDLTGADVNSNASSNLNEAALPPVFCLGASDVKIDEKSVIGVSTISRKRSTDDQLACDIPSKKLLHVKSDNGLPVIAGDGAKNKENKDRQEITKTINIDPQALGKILNEFKTLLTIRTLEDLD